MTLREWLILLGLVAVEAVLIYGIALGLARWTDDRRTRRLAAERGEGLR